MGVEMNQKINIDQLIDSFNAKGCQRPQPAGEYGYRNCGSNRPEVCSYCANLHHIDSKIYIESGIKKTEPETAEEGQQPRNATNDSYKFFFVTISGPSFGKVHSRNNNGHCLCGQIHPQDDPILGVAFNATNKTHKYNYLDQVIWNSNASLLWKRSAENFRRYRIKEAEHVRVFEWQKRGVLHSHAIFKIPDTYSDETILEAFHYLRNQTVLDTQNPIKKKDGSTEPRIIKWGGAPRANEPMKWSHGGFQIDKLEISDKAVPRYMTKVIGYTAKNVGKNDLIKTHPGRIQMIDNLDKAAREKFICGKKCKGKECKNRAHNQFGFNGQILTATTNWSDTTKTEIANRRKEYAEEKMTEKGLDAYMSEIQQQHRKNLEIGALVASKKQRDLIQKDGRELFKPDLARRKRLLDWRNSQGS